MWIRLPLALLLTSLPLLTRAEYHPQALSQALGQYIASADYIAKLQDSLCEFTVKDKPATKKQILNEAYLALLRSDYQSVVNYLDSNEYRETINKNFAAISNQAQKVGQNREQACNYLYQNFIIQYRYTQDRWYFVKKYHAR